MEEIKIISEWQYGYEHRHKTEKEDAINQDKQIKKKQKEA